MESKAPSPSVSRRTRGERSRSCTDRGRWFPQAHLPIPACTPHTRGFQRNAALTVRFHTTTPHAHAPGESARGEQLRRDAARPPRRDRESRPARRLVQLRPFLSGARLGRFFGGAPVPRTPERAFEGKSARRSRSCPRAPASRRTARPRSSVRSTGSSSRRIAASELSGGFFRRVSPPRGCCGALLQRQGVAPVSYALTPPRAGLGAQVGEGLREQPRAIQPGHFGHCEGTRRHRGAGGAAMGDPERTGAGAGDCVAQVRPLSHAVMSRGVRRAAAYLGRERLVASCGKTAGDHSQVGEQRPHRRELAAGFCADQRRDGYDRLDGRAHT